MSTDEIKKNSFLEKILDKRWKRVAVFTAGWVIIAIVYGVIEVPQRNARLFIASNILGYLTFVVLYIVGDMLLAKARLRFCRYYLVLLLLVVALLYQGWIYLFTKLFFVLIGDAP